MGYSYLIVFNLLSPLNFFPPSAVPPPLSLSCAPTPFLSSAPNEKLVDKERERGERGEKERREERERERERRVRRERRERV